MGRALVSRSEAEPLNPYPEKPVWQRVISTYDQALFLDEHQYALVATVAALMIPSGPADPGATEAGVVDFIDSRLADSQDRGDVFFKKRRDAYTQGLAWLDDLSRKEHGTGFLHLDAREQIDLLHRIDQSVTKRTRSVSSFIERVERKIDTFWDDLFGMGKQSSFFKIIHKDVLIAFYSNPISWWAIGYYGPPQPVGYLDFTQPSASSRYSGAIRPVKNESCRICHHEGEKHARGKLIDHTCMTCHRPHSPWPSREGAFHLEDHVGVLFESPDM